MSQRTTLSADQFDALIDSMADDAVRYYRSRGYSPAEAIGRAVRDSGLDLTDRDLCSDINRHGPDKDKEEYRKLKRRLKQHEDSVNGHAASAVYRLHAAVGRELAKRTR